jgi:enoyl-CoA hydratase/carnithine racemase
MARSIELDDVVMEKGVAVIDMRGELHPGRVDSLYATVSSLNRDDTVQSVLLHWGAQDAARSGNGASKSSAWDWAALQQLNYLGAALLGSRPPVVSCMHGRLDGFAFELAMLSDIRIAADDTRASLSLVREGLTPSLGALDRVFEAGGHALLIEMALLGREMTAQECLDARLVSRMAPAADVDDLGKSIATQIAESPAFGVKMARFVLSSLGSGDIDRRRIEEFMTLILAFESEDRAELLRSHIEGRDPVYKNR